MLVYSSAVVTFAHLHITNGTTHSSRGNEKKRDI